MVRARGSRPCTSSWEEKMASSDAAIESVLIRVAKSGCVVKSQQRDEPELTEEEKVSILREILAQKPATFLMRFGKHLAKEDLSYFEHSEGHDYEVDFRLKELRTYFNSKKSKVNVRNRRYECLRRLMRDSDYFSDESMKKRCPLLYEQYVGKYLTEEEKLERDKTELGEEPSLSDFLQFRQEREMTEWMFEYQKEQEEQGLEEEDSSSDNKSDDGEQRGDTECQHEERQMMHEEFLSVMQNKFLRGEDIEFDYHDVDTNADYDDLKLKEREEEDRYFDEEEPCMSGCNS